MNPGPHYLVLFLRHAPPNVEVCEQVPMALVTEALAITDSYGARWGEVSSSRCIGGPRMGGVRVQLGTLPDGRLGRTHTDTADGYATTSIVTIPPSATPKLLAHELSHAQGIADVCGEEGHACPLASLPANLGPSHPGSMTAPMDVLHLDLRGHLMHPDSSAMGLDVVGMRWAVKQVYR